MTSSNTEREQFPEQGVTYTKAGLTLQQVLSDSNPRDNFMHPNRLYDPDAKKPETFTEREGLINLDNFLGRIIREAEEIGDATTTSLAKNIREHLVYVGEVELQEAVHGIAERILTTASAGRDVFISIGGLRSERYISLRVLQEIDRLTEEHKEVRQRVRMGEYKQDTIAEKCYEQRDKAPKIYVLDDFVVSGARIGGQAGASNGEFDKRRI